MNRVVITGSGTINPLGNNVEETLTSMGEGRCGIGPLNIPCLLYTSPSPRDATLSRMPSSA